MNNNAFLYIMFSFCFSLLLAGSDSGDNGFIPPGDVIVACDTSDGYEVKRIIGNQVKKLLLVTSTMSDDNLTLKIHPYKNIDTSQLKIFHEIDNNSLCKMIKVVFSRGAFCCAIEFFGNSYKVLYQYWRICGSSGNKKVFPIDLNSARMGRTINPTGVNYYTIIIPFMTTLQKEIDSKDKKY